MNSVKKSRRLWLTVVILLVAGAASLIFGCSLQPRASKQPQLAGSMFWGMGAVPGETSTEIQRITYEASISNNGTAPLQGWKWELAFAPEVKRLLVREEHRVDPEPAAMPNLQPGQSVKVTGYIDMRTEGMSKEELSAIKEPVVVRITDSNGNEPYPGGPAQGR